MQRHSRRLTSIIWPVIRLRSNLQCVEWDVKPYCAIPHWDLTSRKLPHKQEKLLDGTGRAWCLRQVSKSDLGVLWPDLDLWPTELKTDVLSSSRTDHVCQFAAKSVICLQNIEFTRLVRDEQTNGRVANIQLIRETTFNHGHVLENAPVPMLAQQSGTRYQTNFVEHKR